MTTPFAFLDTLLIAPFQLPVPPEAAFVVGICVLALASAGLGLAGKALVARAQRMRWSSQEAEAKKRHDLSVLAAQEGNRSAYLIQNDLAQEAYGNTMALSAGRAAALLWPGCAVLTWLSWRFESVPLPFLWDGASPVAFFLPAFVAALWGLGRLAGKKKRRAPLAENAAP